jgi:hypothetical protein
MGACGVTSKLKVELPDAVTVEVKAPPSGGVPTATATEPWVALCGVTLGAMPVTNTVAAPELDTVSVAVTFCSAEQVALESAIVAVIAN